MTNEELARRIQNGETDLMLQLWEQVRRFVAQQAKRLIYKLEGRYGVEADDLISAGYIALYAACATYRPEEGKFLTWYGYFLKNEFARTCGYKTSKRDLLNRADSLDVPIGEDGDTTKGDMLADPVDQFADAEHKIWLEQLQEAMGKAMDALPAEWRDVLHRYYWQGQTLEEIGKATGVNKNNVWLRHGKGLRQLRRTMHRFGLDQFVEERTPYYARVGVDSFNATHTSAVEYAVIRRETLEQIYDRLGI